MCDYALDRDVRKQTERTVNVQCTQPSNLLIVTRQKPRTLKNEKQKDQNIMAALLVDY
jgi:hypothetical protein